jgi:Tat protein secretion system quality control protein TatD with DNase activity
MAADYVPAACAQHDAAAALARALKKSGRNEACGLPLVALTLAEAYGCDVAELAAHTTRNAVAFFGLERGGGGGGGSRSDQ